MKTLLLGSALTLVAVPAFAQDESCGQVSISQMNWASAAVVTNVASFILEHGYGCDVKKVPTDTVPVLVSVAENNEPDIVTELWLNGVGEVYDRLKSEGRLVDLGPVLDPGGVDGWWIPDYLAEEHPELKTIDGVLENPELVGGRFHNCPVGWGCRVFNDNLLPAFGVEEAGIEIFNHGSGETLASSIGAAYEDKKPWFGYYWSPTSILSRYDLVKVDMGPVDEEEFVKVQDPHAKDVSRTGFPPGPVVTAVTNSFSDEHPELVDFLSQLTFSNDTMNEILLWMEENNASGEEGAVYFLTNHQDTWSGWLNDAAAENLSQSLQ